MKRENLPSKKFVISVGVLGMMVLVIFLLTHRSWKKDTNTATGEVVSQETTPDSDGDGLTDWEEALWGTDPKNPHSVDQDMSDSEWVNSRRLTIQSEEPSDAENTLTPSDTSATDQFLDDYISIYGNLLTTNSATPETQQNIAGNVSEALALQAKLPDIYDLEDISLARENAPLLDYQNALESAFERNSSGGIVGTELSLMATLVGESDVSVIPKLETIANAYEQFSLDVLRISVPELVSGEHLALANNAHNMNIAIKNFILSIGDPIMSTTGIMQYREYSTTFEESANTIIDYLSQ